MKIISVLFLAAVAFLAGNQSSMAEDEKHEAAHAEHEEEDSSIGPEKGILEKGPEGFRLSPEAIATFAFKTEKMKSAFAPKAAIVLVKDKKYVYRLRGGWIKRISPQSVNAGDEIIVSATGFIRTAEIVTEEGLASEH